MRPKDPPDEQASVSVTIPAVAAPDRDGLELGVVPLDGPGARRMLLTAGTGAALLELGPQKGFFVFAHGEGQIMSAGQAEGRAFVDAVAQWLGMEPDEAPARSGAPTEAPAKELSLSWVRLGDGDDVFGVRWKGFKLFLSDGEGDSDEKVDDGQDAGEDDRYAEVFLRLSSDGRRAQLLEKWSEYRRALIGWFERALTQAPPRRWTPRRAAEPITQDGLSFGVAGGFELHVPPTWRVTHEPEGHHRLTDPDDEMMIEISSFRLPPLPPNAPDAAARLQGIIDGSEHGRAASAIRRFERGDASFAWVEYAFDSKDTKRPEAAPRPARGRWLVGSNAWVQVLVTSCWWQDDVVVAERAWDDVVASIRIPSRVNPASDAGGAA